LAHVVSVRGWTPQVHPTAWIAPNAVLIGQVIVEAHANVWFGAVLRADQNVIRIGERSSVQDNVVIHCNEEHPTIVGANVTVGHGVTMEGCTIEDWAMIGMNAAVLDGARVGEGALLAAGGVVKERDAIPGWTLAAGVPAVPRRKLEGAALATVKSAAEHYQRLMALYERDGRPIGAPTSEETR
jgi:carbonic anhydrase/acetyltransferase-like protein (isoleucine patch superfamily)